MKPVADGENTATVAPPSDPAATSPRLVLSAEPLVAPGFDGRSAAVLLSWLVGLGLLLMAAVGHWRYSSIGFELDTVVDGVIRQDLYRVRWPGNGSVWVGTGWFHLPLDTKPVEAFDVGAAFFIPPPPGPVPQSDWNRWGFWRVWRASPSELPLLSRSGESWWGVPGWLPGVSLLLLTSWFSRRPALTSAARRSP
ncbi:MAG: hypothetical protein V4739_19010 [Pseudomonadota bacterium]